MKKRDCDLNDILESLGFQKSCLNGSKSFSRLQNGEDYFMGDLVILLLNKFVT